VNQAGRLEVVSCGIFVKELSCIEEGLRARIHVRYLDSMLHMKPGLLEERLVKALENGPAPPRLVLFGDCCPHMGELGSAPGRVRIDAINCVEIALGKERYRALRKEGAFFFMPEWLSRWEEVFGSGLGFSDPELAKDFMRESAGFFVYVDTGCKPVPVETLEEVSRHFSLPWRVESCGLGGIERALREALGRVDENA